MREQKDLIWMNALAAFLVVGATAFALWVVLGSWVPKSTLALVGVSAFFICSPIGALWMLYDCAVREKPPLIYFLLAFFVPYSFVWYYFDRVRHRNRGGVRKLPSTDSTS
jgi:hypothetical protein